MHILHTKSDLELYQSILAEVAKATNELKCSRQDQEKAQGRLSFCLAALNELIDRKGD
jgi:hypothetical protein